MQEKSTCGITGVPTKELREGKSKQPGLGGDGKKSS